jgi:hypothetical protein
MLFNNAIFFIWCTSYECPEYIYSHLNIRRESHLLNRSKVGSAELALKLHFSHLLLLILGLKLYIIFHSKNDLPILLPKNGEWYMHVSKNSRSIYCLEYSRFSKHSIESSRKRSWGAARTVHWTVMCFWVRPKGRRRPRTVMFDSVSIPKIRNTRNSKWSIQLWTTGPCGKHLQS